MKNRLNRPTVSIDTVAPPKASIVDRIKKPAAYLIAGSVIVAGSIKASEVHPIDSETTSLTQGDTLHGTIVDSVEDILDRHPDIDINQIRGATSAANRISREVSHENGYVHAHETPEIRVTLGQNAVDRVLGSFKVHATLEDANPESNS